MTTNDPDAFDEHGRAVSDAAAAVTLRYACGLLGLALLHMGVGLWRWLRGTR
jgi:hypothetical protein